MHVDVVSDGLDEPGQSHIVPREQFVVGSERYYLPREIPSTSVIQVRRLFAGTRTVCHTKIPSHRKYF